MDSAEWTAGDLEIAKSLNSKSLNLKIKKLNQVIIEGTIKELTENGFVIDCNNELFSVISLSPVVTTKRFKQGDEIRVVGYLAIGSKGIEIKADFIDRK